MSNFERPKQLIETFVHRPPRIKVLRITREDFPQICTLLRAKSASMELRQMEGSNHEWWFTFKLEDRSEEIGRNIEIREHDSLVWTGDYVKPLDAEIVSDPKFFDEYELVPAN